MEWLGYQTVRYYEKFSLQDLKLNHALVIANTTLKDIGIYVLEDSCLGCPYTLRHSLDNESYWEVDTSITTRWRVMRTENYKYYNSQSLRGLICELRPTLGEFGVYTLNIGTCELREEVAPVNSYLPLVLWLATLISLGCLHILSKLLFKYLRQIFNSKDGVSHSVDKIIIQLESANYSLNVFRGLLIVLIVFLTSGAGGYSLLTKEYGGLSIADCALFMLIWTVGFKIPLTVQKMWDAEERKWAMLSQIAKKSATLIMIGTTIDSTMSRCQLNPFPIWYPLQKIGIGYFVAGCVYVLSLKRFTIKSKKLCNNVIEIFTSLILCWIISSLLMATLFVLLTAVSSFNIQPVKNSTVITKFVSRSNSIDEVTNNAFNNISRYMNMVLVGKGDFLNLEHHYGFSGGLIGLLLSTLYCLIGLKAGFIYLSYETNSDRISLWSIWGGIFTAFGIFLGGTCSLIKFNLWPLATVFVISAAAFFMISLLYIASEKLGLRSSSVNALGVTFLLILCGHMLFSTSIPFYWNLEFKNHLHFLLQNVWILFLWSCLATFLCKKGLRFSL